MNTSSDNTDHNTDPTNTNSSDNTNDISYLYNGNVMEALRELTSSSSPKQYLFVFITHQSNDQLLINFNNNIQIKQFLLQSNIICINIINNTVDYNNFIAFYNVQSIPSLYVLNKNGINIHFNLNPNLDNLINNFNQSINNINTTTNSNTTTSNTSNNTVAAASSSSSSGSNYDTDIYGEEEVSNNGNDINSDNNQDSRIPQYNYDLINKESTEEKKRKIEEALEKARKRLNRNTTSSSSNITNNSNSNTTTTSNSMSEDVMIEEVQTPTTPITPISPFTSSSTNMENENYNRIKKELSFKKKQELEYKKKLKEQIKLDRQNQSINNSNNTPSPSTTNFGNVYNLNNLKNENYKIDSNNNSTSNNSKIESNNSNSSNNLNKTSNIAFKLPNGQVIKQVFKIQDTIKDLREFKNNNIENGNEYEMILAFPRSVLTSDEYDHLTLENLKLIPSASILLQSNNNSTGNSNGGNGSRSDSVDCEAHSSRSGGGVGLIDTTSRLFTYIIITLISSIQWISSKLFNTNNNNNNRNNNTNANANGQDSRVNKRNQELRDNGNSTQFEYPSDDEQQDKKNQ